MNQNRRSVLKMSGALAMLVSAGLISAEQALAQVDPRQGFAAKNLAEMLTMIGGVQSSSDELQIIAPDIAENGAVVPVSVTSKIPDARKIFIFVENNPTPLAAIFTIPVDTESYVQTRVKLGQSTSVTVIVQAKDKLYTASKEVKVTLGGCGG